MKFSNAQLVIFFPIFRCYFKIPYLFCHVCPRQCAFGYLRPYLVPAALLMNIEKRFWCFHCCPIGPSFDCQARVSSKPLRLPRFVKTLPILVLIFWIGVYPQTFLKPVQPAIEQTITLTQERAEMCRELDPQTSLSSGGEAR